MTKTTVTRLMELADDYADWAMAKGQEHPAYLQTRQALHDELVRLFTPLNQCDGCMSGQPMRGPLHIDSDGKSLMACQKSKYGIGGES